MELGYDVHVLADGTSSLYEIDRKIGLVRLRQAGVIMESSQQVMFEFIGDTNAPEFLQLYDALKMHRHNVINDI